MRQYHYSATDEEHKSSGRQGDLSKATLLGNGRAGHQPSLPTFKAEPSPAFPLTCCMILRQFICTGTSQLRRSGRVEKINK